MFSERLGNEDSEEKRSLKGWADFKMGLLMDAKKTLMTFLAGGGEETIEETSTAEEGHKSNNQQSACRLKPKNSHLEEHCFDKLTNYLGKCTERFDQDENSW